MKITYKRNELELKRELNFEKSKKELINEIGKIQEEKRIKLKFDNLTPIFNKGSVELFFRIYCPFLQTKLRFFANRFANISARKMQRGCIYIVIFYNYNKNYLCKLN